MSEELLSNGESLLYEKFRNIARVKIPRHIFEDQKSQHKARLMTDDNIIDIPYMFNIYNRQNGKCDVCSHNVKLDITGCKSCNYSLSIDRIDDRLPHIKGNVVITCLHCNKYGGLEKPKQCSYINWGLSCSYNVDRCRYNPIYISRTKIDDDVCYNRRNIIGSDSMVVYSRCGYTPRYCTVYKDNIIDHCDGCNSDYLRHDYPGTKFMLKCPKC